MRAREELVARLVGKRAEQLGTLSSGAYEQLVLAVRANPESFVEDTSDTAFYQLVLALERNDADRARESMLEDDDAFYSARVARLKRLVADCRGVLAIDVSCLDAALLCVLAADEEPTRTLDGLIELERHERESRGRERGSVPEAMRAAEARARLRLRAAISRSHLECANYTLARDTARAVMAEAAGDPVGARHTCALALARLEDEPGFDALDVSFGRSGSAWDYLGRTILLYKLGRMSAAHRALDGFARLCDGGAFALLDPCAVDVYLPDRPEVPHASYEESVLAVWEAGPILTDVPDFIGWAAGQPGFLASAQEFAQRNDFDW